MTKKINYDYINNNKRTLVLLHGWGMDKTAFDELVHFFCKDYSVLILDFLGHGKSENPEEYFDTYEYAYQTYLLLKELDIDECVLVGHSFGGRIAILLSSIFDVNVKGLILTSSAGLNRFDLLKKIKICKYKITKKLCQLNMLPKTILNKYGSSDYKNLDANMKKIFVRIVNQDLTYCLDNINVKTYLVWDKKDKSTPYWICKKLHRCIKVNRIVVYKNGGHFACFYNINKFSAICSKLLNL